MNGERLQFGPAPSDPRWAEADPVDFTNKLKNGVNVIGVEVLYYGYGDGTCAIGKPGLIFKLDIDLLMALKTAWFQTIIGKQN